MSTSLVKVNGAEAAPVGSDKTVIHVTITQESALASLVKAVAAARGPKSAPTAAAGASPGRLRCNGEQKVLGGAQILLGLVCISLGVVVSLQNRYIRAVQTGAPFWMGSLFIISGTFSVVGERRRGFWVFVATVFNLASLVASSVALAEGVAEVPSPYSQPFNVDYLCKKQRPARPWWATPAPPSPSPVYDWRAAECKQTLANLMMIANTVQILLLIFSIAGLAIALFCFGCGLRDLCCSLRTVSEDYVAVGDVEVPPPYEDHRAKEAANGAGTG
ncbi:membrane-spanning 4-domains subfamily A member 8-like [Hemicordylus capensis]|uniref:membrane-spanning 4-domains subfamily A member 8-like n=1 Tax=Hemicordylus capensis TaxID=884348 RepID=UPI002304CD8E|nr:membrane-spanning 4-domains subfamily A member 8-like [Hemicordylus capensis]